MQDLIEKKVDTMIGLESQLDPYEKTLFRDDGIHRVFRSVGTVHRIDVNKPIYVGALRPLLEDGIDYVRIDVPLAVGDCHVYQVGSFFLDSRVRL